MRLFEIRDQIEHVLATEVDEHGEIQDSALEKLSALGVELEALALDLAAYAVGEHAEAEAVAAQAKRLGERAARHGRRAAWLEGVIARNLAPGQKLRDERVSISWRRSTAVQITDEAALPDELFRYTRAADKAEIKRKLTAGKKVPGAELVTRDNLVIR